MKYVNKFKKGLSKFTQSINNKISDGANDTFYLDSVVSNGFIPLFEVNDLIKDEVRFYSYE